jgi:glucokinase
LKNVDAASVFAGAAQNDEICQSVLDNASHYLGLGLAYLVNLFNPQMIVLGGGVIANHHEWLDSIRANTKKFSMDAMYGAVTIAPATLGTNSGLQGALAAGVMGQTR